MRSRVATPSVLRSHRARELLEHRPYRKWGRPGSNLGPAAYSQLLYNGAMRHAEAEGRPLVASSRIATALSGSASLRVLVTHSAPRHYHRSIADRR